MGKQSLFIAAKEDFQDLFCFLKTRGGVPLTVYGEEIHPEDPRFSIPGAAFVHFPAHSKVEMTMHSSGRSVLSMDSRNHCIEVAEHGAGILDYSLPVSRIYIHTTASPDSPTPNWLSKEYQALLRYIQRTAVEKDKSSIVVSVNEDSQSIIESNNDNNSVQVSYKVTIPLLSNIILLSNTILLFPNT